MTAGSTTVDSAVACTSSHSDTSGGCSASSPSSHASTAGASSREASRPSPSATIARPRRNAPLGPVAASSSRGVRSSTSAQVSTYSAGFLRGASAWTSSRVSRSSAYARAIATRPLGTAPTPSRLHSPASRASSALAGQCRRGLRELALGTIERKIVVGRWLGGGVAIRLRGPDLLVALEQLVLCVLEIFQVVAERADPLDQVLERLGHVRHHARLEHGERLLEEVAAIGRVDELRELAVLAGDRRLERLERAELSLRQREVVDHDVAVLENLAPRGEQRVLALLREDIVDLDLVDLFLVFLDEIVVAQTLLAIELGSVDVFILEPQSSIFSHHWHHHSAPTRIRSFGCQQYAMFLSVSR